MNDGPLSIEIKNFFKVIPYYKITFYNAHSRSFMFSFCMMQLQLLGNLEKDFKVQMFFTRKG